MTDALSPGSPSELPFGPPHPRLDPRYAWDADGSLALLDTPLLPGYVSRRAADADVVRYTRMALRLCAEGWTLAGGFVGARERALLDTLARALPGLRVIRFEPSPFAECRLTAASLAAIRGGRLLRLTTAAADEVCTRALCVRHNRLAEALAGPWRTAVEAHFARAPETTSVQLGHLRDWLTAWPSPGDGG